MEKAVIDRIIDGKTAVILVGDDERQHHCRADALPEGAKEGTWLRVRVESGKIVSMEVDEGETDGVRSRIHKKLENLRARGRKAS